MVHPVPYKTRAGQKEFGAPSRGLLWREAQRVERLRVGNFLVVLDVYQDARNH
jgi:hypothetical protein